MTDLIERLERRKAFGRNGHTWIMLAQPDPDCQEAAARIRELEAGLEALLFTVEEVRGNEDTNDADIFYHTLASRIEDLIAKSKKTSHLPTPPEGAA